MFRPLSVTLFAFLSTGQASADSLQDCKHEENAELAIKACSDVIGTSSDSALAYFKRGSAHIRHAVSLLKQDQTQAQSTFDFALKDLNRSIELDPRNSEAFRMRGDVLSDERDRNKAMTDYETAIRLEPRNWRALNGRGSLLAWSYDQEKEFRRRHLDYSNRWNCSGNGCLDRAIADFTAAIAISPATEFLYRDRAAALLQRGLFQRGIEDLSKILQLPPKNMVQTLAQRANAYVRGGQADLGLKDAEEALKLEPESLDALKAKGGALEALGRNKDAGQAFRIAAWIDPADTQAQQAVSRLHSEDESKTAAACGPRRTKDERTYKQVTVSIAASASVGEPIKVIWSLPNQPRPEAPAYLVVTAGDLARFDGSGFYALTPSAANPTGIKYGLGSTRSITPLGAAFSATSGTIEVLPLMAGSLKLRWAVVGYDGCEEWKAADGASDDISVAAGVPELLVRDEYSTLRPEHTVEAAKGPYAVRVFRDRYEVFDRSSGLPVVSRQGHNPGFSPTGRFLVALSQVADTYEVIDLAARRVIGRYEANSIAWSHGDSFMFFEENAISKMLIVRTLIGKRHGLNDYVLTRREQQIADDVPLDQEASDRKPRPPGLDIEPDGTTCARGCYARDHWLLDMSIDRGTVTFFDIWEGHKDKGPPMLVYDLAGRADSVVFASGVEDRSKYIGMFSFVPELRRWNVGDRLRTTMFAYPTDLEKTMIVETGREVAAPPGPAAAVATASVARTVIPRDASAALAPVAVIGNSLNHAPGQPIVGFRGARDTESLRKVEAEIAPLYAPDVAVFGGDIKSYYFRAPFPDPQHRPREAPWQFDLTADGRDLWRFTAANSTYWLTQTVASTHIGYRFRFTMLSRDANGGTRWINLIKAADGKQSDPSAEQMFSDPVENSSPFGQLQLGDFRDELGNAFGDMSLVTVSGDRYLLLLSKPLPRLMVFDLRDWRVVCRVPNPIDGADAVALMADADVGT